MRTAALTLLAASACNQILGLDDTHPIDGAGPVLPHATLLYAVPTSKVVGNVGAPDTVALVPIPASDVEVRVGLPGEALAPAPYDDAGRVTFPEAFLDQPWRLEYKLGGIAHELLWKPPRDLGKLVVPAYGGIGRTPLAAGLGYDLTPMRTSAPPAPTMVTQARAFTTGAWGATTIGAAAVPVRFDLDAIGRTTGGLGTPDGARGDSVVLVDYQLVNACTLAKGGGAALAPAPAAPATPVDVTWLFQKDAVAFFSYNEAPNPATVRLQMALGPRASMPSNTQAATSYGYTADVSMPAFAEAADGVGPVLVTLASCIGVPDTTPTPPAQVFADIPNLGLFPRMAQARIVDVRRASGNGPLLESSISAVGVLAQDSMMNQRLVMDLRTPLALSPKLVGADPQPLDLDTAADGTLFHAGTAPVQLGFSLEALGMGVDYVEVTLYRVDHGNQRLAAEHAYISTDVVVPHVAIDPAVFTAGREYVFALRAYRGRPQAAAGDWTAVTYPQAVTTVYTSTFTVN